MVVEVSEAKKSSGVYVGHVRHRRFLPVENSFRYRVFMMYLDLDELPTLFDDYVGWSYERFNIASFHRRYFYGDASVPLKQAVLDKVEQETGRRPSGAVRMLTHLRYMGYCYNPVTFYYCYNKGAELPDSIATEITNTPWGERHTYVLDCQKHEGPGEGRYRWHFPKEFHVSPFMPMDIMYDWRFRAPDDHLNVHMQDIIKGDKYFDATLTLERREISQGMLMRALVQYPLMTTKVIAGIHWQALKLWAKGAPFHKHPKRAEGRPHE